MKDSPLIVALDLELKEALALAKKLDPRDCKLKVGSQLFTSAGPELIKELSTLGFDVFLDLKFYDIPNTVEKAVKSAMSLKVWMINIHASGGSKMLKAAVKGCRGDKRRPFLIGVTLLTSLDKPSIRELGITSKLQDHVLLLSKLCKTNGLDGVVCSPNEISVLRKEMGQEFILVTPGIRSDSSNKHDQSRTSTISEALSRGANYIVIGRQITLSKDPPKEVDRIIKLVSGLD